MHWTDDAACLGEDPELFFPGGETPRYALQVEAALAVCHDCTVREECLTVALQQGQQEGIWGGTTAGQRSALRRRSVRTPAVG